MLSHCRGLDLVKQVILAISCCRHNMGGKNWPIKNASVKTGVAAGWNRLCTKPGTNYFVLLYLACGDDVNARYWMM